MYAGDSPLHTTEALSPTRTCQSHRLSHKTGETRSDVAAVFVAVSVAIVIVFFFGGIHRLLVNCKFATSAIKAAVGTSCVYQVLVVVGGWQ